MQTKNHFSSCTVHIAVVHKLVVNSISIMTSDWESFKPMGTTERGSHVMGSSHSPQDTEVL